MAINAARTGFMVLIIYLLASIGYQKFGAVTRPIAQGRVGEQLCTTYETRLPGHTFGLGKPETRRRTDCVAK